MSAITSAVNGNWSSGGTWVGGIAPVAGDTVTIAAGHVIHFDSGASPLVIGSDPGTGGTAAIIIGSVAQTTATQLILDAGTSLTLRGDLNVVGQNTNPGAVSSLTLNAGASLVMGPPSAGHYLINLTQAAQLFFNGTSGSHCVVKTDKTRGGTNSYMPTGTITSPNYGGGIITATYTDLTNFGTTSIRGLVTVLTNSFSAPAGNINISNCTFTGCSFGMLDELSSGWTGAYTFSSNIMAGSISTTDYWTSACYGNSFNGSTAASKTVSNSSFDLSVVVDGGTGYTFGPNNVFAGGLVFSQSSTWVDDSHFSSNFVVCSATGGGATLGVPTKPVSSINGCYVATLVQFPAQFVVVSPGNTVTGCIFDIAHATGAGFTNGIVIPSGSGIVTAKLNLALQGPTAGATNRCVGSIWIPNSVAGSIVVAEHNLQLGQLGQGMLAVGDATAAAGQIASCRANIIWAGAAAQKVLAINEAGANTNTLDLVTVAGHNGYFHNTTGTVKTSAGGVSTGSVPLYDGIEVTAVGSPLSGGNTQVGLGDFSADPMFVDSTRNLATWGGTATGGGVATAAAAIATLQANPLLVTKPGVGLIPWVLAGYVPTNSAYLPANHPSYSGDASTVDALGNGWAGGAPGVGPLSVAPSYATGGATSGTVGTPSANISVTPSATIGSDTITISDGGAGGTITPSTLTFSASSAGQNFTYNAASAGSKTLTLTSADGYSITGSPITFIASNPVSTTGAAILLPMM